MDPRQRNDAELRRLNRIKAAPAPPTPGLGGEIVSFFKTSVQKRQTRLGRLADAWQQLVPAPLAEHTSLESLTRGNLVVLVDSASHLYDLKQLLLAGLEQQILLACKTTGLRKITLKPGRWYETADNPADRRLRFD